MQGQKKILIVDDDSRNIFALRAVLKSKGLECATADNAVKAMAMMQEDKAIGIVLMDMMMPGMDGYAALEEIDRNEVLKRIPVIAVTAQAMDGDKKKCLEAGAAAYVSKPIDVDVLMELLKKY